MSQKNWQKIKLVRLLELLRQESDEEHPLTTNQICDYMLSMDIPCDRRVVSRDVALLNKMGFEVMATWVGKSKAYYIEDRSFSIPELRILIDAVKAACFITDKKTEDLADKIAGLAGSYKAEALKNNKVCFNNRKHSNENIYYNVDALEDAIQQKKKVVFRYFDLGIKHEKVYRRDGSHYVVEPLALIYNEDNYYLIAHSADHDGPTTYRVDRMDGVYVIDEGISEEAQYLRVRAARYSAQAIKMYGGEPKMVTLEFEKNLNGAVYDRFGEKIKMKTTEEGKNTVTVKVQISPTFWGWLFQFGKQMRIVSPEEVAEEYRARLEETLEQLPSCGSIPADTAPEETPEG